MINKKRGKPAQKNEQRLKNYLDGKQEDNGINALNIRSFGRCAGNCGCVGNCGNKKNNRS